MIRFVLLGGIAAVSIAMGDELPDYCKRDNPYIIGRTYVQEEPNYFFRVFPDRYWVSFIGSKSDNLILDLESGKLTQLPGSYDPVPLWHDPVMTVPSGSTGGMIFYDLSVALEKGKNARYLYHDTKLAGVYQSVGYLGKVDGKNRYRILASDETMEFKDFEVQRSEEGTKIVPIGETVRVCRDRLFKLPQISKDGSEISVFDKSDNKTKVVRLDPKTGECTEVLDLGVGAGKADFSFDGKKLAFHVTNLPISEHYILPDPEQKMTVFVYDREKKTFQQISQSLSSNAHYPSWRPDGHLFYMETEYLDEQTARYSFVHADPGRSKMATPLGSSNCQNCELAEREKQQSAQISLGAIWESTCRKTVVGTPGRALLIASGLSGDSCRKMVQEKFEVWKSEAVASESEILRAASSEVVLEDLLAACPALQDPQPSPIAVRGAGTAAELFQRKCSLCHSQAEMPFDSVATLKGMKSKNGKPLIEEILGRINSVHDSDRMPKGGSLRRSERLLIESALGGSQGSPKKR